MKYSALKGIRDIFPPEIYLWQKIEKIADDVFSAYGFQEIRPPIIESSDIFIRSIGETTDIVEKEMYTFNDKAGRLITLRPEGTASVVRCYIEHHLYNLPTPQKFFYSGPMFRYERPQAGRFRQFYQIGAEAFGIADPKIDAEILSMLKVFLEKLDLSDLTFELNSIGCGKCRPDYRKALLNFLYAKQQLQNQNTSQNQTNSQDQDNKQKQEPDKDNKRNQSERENSSSSASRNEQPQYSPTDVENLLNLIKEEEKKHIGKKEKAKALRVYPRNEW